MMGTVLMHQTNYGNQGIRLAEADMKLLFADTLSYWPAAP